MMTYQTQTQEPNPRGAKDLGTRDSPAWQHKKKTNKTKCIHLIFVCQNIVQPISILQTVPRTERSFCFHDIQLTHHAKDLDCFSFFMIPSFPKPVSVRD